MDDLSFGLFFSATQTLIVASPAGRVTQIHASSKEDQLRLATAEIGTSFITLCAEGDECRKLANLARLVSATYTEAQKGHKTKHMIQGDL